MEPLMLHALTVPQPLTESIAVQTMPNPLRHAATARVIQMIVVTLGALLVATPGGAQTAGAAALAAAVSNPVAALMSVPIQFNYEEDIGPDRASERWTINVQPVIPFTLNDASGTSSRARSCPSSCMTRSSRGSGSRS